MEDFNTRLSQQYTDDTEVVELGSEENLGDDEYGDDE